MAAPQIVDYDPSWPERYEDERLRIANALGDLVESIEHVGSTGVPGLAAKPVVDVMVGVRSEAELDPTVRPIAALGFEYVPQYEDEMPFRRYFRRRLGLHANVHVVPVGSDFWERHLLFRDYLRAHPEVAAEYAQHKRELAAKHDNSADYTAAKTDFILAVEEKARAEGEVLSKQVTGQHPEA